MISSCSCRCLYSHSSRERLRSVCKIFYCVTLQNHFFRVWQTIRCLLRSLFQCVFFCFCLYTAPRKLTRFLSNCDFVIFSFIPFPTLSSSSLLLAYKRKNVLSAARVRVYKTLNYTLSPSFIMDVMTIRMFLFLFVCFFKLFLCACCVLCTLFSLDSGCFLVRCVLFSFLCFLCGQERLWLGVVFQMNSWFFIRFFSSVSFLELFYFLVVLCYLFFPVVFLYFYFL